MRATKICLLGCSGKRWADWQSLLLSQVFQVRFPSPILSCATPTASSFTPGYLISSCSQDILLLTHPLPLVTLPEFSSPADTAWEPAHYSQGNSYTNIRVSSVSQFLSSQTLQSHHQFYSRPFLSASSSLLSSSQVDHTDLSFGMSFLTLTAFFQPLPQQALPEISGLLSTKKQVG